MSRSPWLGGLNAPLTTRMGGGLTLHLDPPAPCPQITKLGGDSGVASCSFGRELESVSDAVRVMRVRCSCAQLPGHAWDGLAPQQGSVHVSVHG